MPSFPYLHPSPSYSAQEEGQENHNGAMVLLHAKLHSWLRHRGWALIARTFANTHQYDVPSARTTNASSELLQLP